MESQKKNTSLPELIKHPSTYKMTVPKEVEEKIRYLQNKFPATEWSGVLFYTHTGSFENNDLAITCRDIFPMGLGNAAYTEFHMSEEVTAYMAERMDTLWECELGLVHSHHNMKTFFSGTDLSTLQSEGAERNNFVSLIVNNEGTYSAAITRKVTRSLKIQENSSYLFFGDGERGKDAPVEYEKTVEEIEYFMLDIEIQHIENSLSYLDKRFEEIQKRNIPSTSVKDRPGLSFNSSATPWLPKRKGIQQDKSLFPEQGNTMSTIDRTGFTSKEPSLFGDDQLVLYDIDSALVRSVVLKMLLCSLLSNTSKVSMEDFVTKSMRRIYDRFFGSAEEIKFQEYVEWIVDYMISYSKPAGVEDDSLWTLSMAVAMRNLLLLYNDANPYMEVFITTIESYIEY